MALCGWCGQKWTPGHACAETGAPRDRPRRWSRIELWLEDAAEDHAQELNDLIAALSIEYADHHGFGVEQSATLVSDPPEWAHEAEEAE